LSLRHLQISKKTDFECKHTTHEPEKMRVARTFNGSRALTHQTAV
jgi:hypothetical protein